MTKIDNSDHISATGVHPSHTTRDSDASTFDEICTACGAHDVAGGGWGDLALPCKNIDVIDAVKQALRDDAEIVSKTTEADDWPEFKEACGKLIQIARRLRPRLMQADTEAAGEYGREAVTLFALAGTTQAEAHHYMGRILAMVIEEHQA